MARTLDYGLFYTYSENYSLSGYIDNDYARNLDDQKRTSRYAFNLGTNLISCASKKQLIILISFVVVEYVDANSIACQAVWMIRLLKDISNV